MALDIGAAPCGDFGSYHAEPIDPRSGWPEPSVFIFPYGILVNQEGGASPMKRPARSTRVRTHHAQNLQPDQRHRLHDARRKVTRVPNYRLGLRTDQPPIAGDTIAELAAKLGIARRTLEHTVANTTRRAATWGVQAAGARRPRDAGLDAAEIELGASARRAAVSRLSGHLVQRAHVRRAQGGRARACSTRRACRSAGCTPRAKWWACTTRTTRARPRC